MATSAVTPPNMPGLPAAPPAPAPAAAPPAPPQNRMSQILADLAAPEEAAATAAPSVPAAASDKGPIRPPLAAPETPTSAAPASEAAPAETAATPAVETEGEFRFSDEEAPQPLAADDPELSALRAEFAGLPAEDLDRIESAVFRTARGHRMVDSLKALRPLAERLGRIPTSDEVADAFQARSDWEASEHDRTADPAQWLTNVLVDFDTGNLKPGADRIIHALPQVLSQTPAGKQLYGQIATGITGRAAETFYEWAAADPDLAEDRPPVCTHCNHQPLSERQQAIQAARTFVHNAFGPDGLKRLDARFLNAPANGKPDPLTAERTSLRQQEDRLRQMEQQGRQTAWQNFDAAVTRDIDAAVEHDIDEALGRIKTSMTEAGYTAFRRGLRQDIITAVQQDPDAARQIRMATDSVRSLSKDEADRITALYRNPARRWLVQNRSRLLGDQRTAVEAQKSASDQRHQQLAAAAAKTGVNGTGTPVAQSVAAIERQKGEDNSAYLKRRIIDDLQNGNL